MNDKPLLGSAVLHAVLKNFDDLFEKVFPSQKDFADYLEELVGDDSGLSVSAVSRWLLAANPIKDAQITSILNDRAHALAVAEKCGLPAEILDLTTRAQVKDFVARHLSKSAPRSSETGSWVVSIENLPANRPEVCRTEERLISQLTSETSKVREHLLVTHAPFDCGISFLWHATAIRELIPSRADAVYFLRPDVTGQETRGIVQNFDAALSWLATKLGLPEKSDGSTILEKLIASRSTAILLSVSGRLDGRAEAVAQVALRSSKRRGQSTAVIISSVLNDKRQQTKLGNPREFRIDEGDVNTALDERYPFFRAQWQRYSHLRQTYRPDEGGSRLKRARWHYASLGERPVYPINIRLRAFFASDLNNFSYFDPTAGFEHLCKMSDEDLPPEVRMFREDVQRWVTLWNARTRDPLIRPLRWCSTAIYWLTQEAADDLGSKYEFEELEDAKKRAVRLLPNLPQNVQSVTTVELENFHEATRSIPAIVSYEPDREHSPGIFRYVAGVGIKAIVQDHWMRTDPARRSYAHYCIAKRLYEKRHRKEALSEEFPFTPHWGRSGIFFLAECIRHLMRSIAPVESVQPPLKAPPKRDDSFVSPPTRAMMGCDPFEVLSFCFGQVYWDEMDGNTSSEMDGRKLSQRHGLYHLSAELLQLMSNGEELGKPHWALDRRLHGKYYACAAFAQFELGNLKSAQQLFRERLAYLQETDKGSLAEMTAALDLVAVKIELQDLERLSAEIEEVEKRLQKPPGKAAESAVKQVRLHCEVLKGQIAYSLKDFDAAHRLLKALYEWVEDDRLSIEASHYLVATLGAKAEALSEKSHRTPEEEATMVALRDEALQIASRRLWHYASEGEQHVALGFRISTAHLFRNMGKLKLAETWMDSVYMDILRYGCSERTYLSFLREAGRIVRATDRPARAYAVYLKPAAIRAASRGHARAAKVAHFEAMQALSEIQTSIKKFGSAWNDELTNQLREPKEFVEKAGTEGHDFVPADPLFSFDLLGGGEWWTRLSTGEAVDAELKEFSDEFEKLRRANI